jgi:hypothetical protein
MKKYGENKIFVEGKSDKIFIDFYFYSSSILKIKI